MVTRIARRLSLLAVLLIATPAYPQETGDIAGTVTDPTGAVLPGVVVTLTGPVLFQPRAAVTGNTGSYRFARLAIGVYALRFDLPRFNTAVREAIKVEIGFNATVDVRLEPSAVSEVVSVTGDSPIVDLRDGTRGGRFTREALDWLPTSRDPWSVIAQTAGVLMALVNVGGNVAAQQSGTVSRGDWTWNNTWTLDGVDITDAAAIGASSIYYDFDSFQEMRITTGGGVSQHTSGIGVNIVTRSGTDVFRGSARLLVTDERLGSENVDDTLRQQGAGAGNPVKNITDSGIEAGGPLKAGRAWLWGAYGRQEIEVGILNFYEKSGACAGLTGASAQEYPLATIRKCLKPNLTTLWATNVKAQIQVRKNHRLSGFTNFTEKVTPNRGASDVRPAETTWRQAAVPPEYGPRLWKTGPSSIWKIGDQHVVTDRWLMELQWTHQGANFATDFADPSLAAEQPAFEITTREWARSHSRSIDLRPVESVTVATEYFRPSALGGDHAITAGARWRSGEWFGESQWGGNTIARYRNGAPAEADLYRNSATRYRVHTQAGWVQDTYTRQRLTVNAGVRWDRQGDTAEASSVPAHPFQGQPTAQGQPFTWLPSVRFEGNDAAPVWNDFSPRLGLNYALSDAGLCVLKASYSRYYAQRAAGWLSGVLNPVTEAMIRFPWSDANGDSYVQAGELDTTRILAFSGNYDPYSPEVLGTENRINPTVRNYRTDEILIGFDRQLAPEFAIAAAYTWRRYSNSSMNAPVGLTSADYVRRSFTPSPASCGESARCETVDYWEPARSVPSTVILTNRPDYERRYHGVEVVARKRLRDRWMLDASFAFNDARQYYRSPRAYQDPTNVDRLDGAQFGVDVTGAGNLGVTPVPNAQWIAKLSGAFALPWWDLGVAGFYQARQGYPLFQQIQTPSRANSAGIAAVLLDPVGHRRYPALHLLDLGASKTFRTGRLRITATLDAFNVANANTVLARRPIQNAASANQVSTIVAPRVIRLGVRIGW